MRPHRRQPRGSPVPGILQARMQEWVAISFSNAWKWKVKVKLFSRVWLLATPWTAAYQAPPSMGFSRQEYRSGLPLPSPESTIAIHIFLPLEPPSHLPPHSALLGWYRAPVWVSWEIQQISLAIYFTCGNVSFHVTLSIHLPSPPLSPCP